MSDLNTLADRVEALAVPCALCGISNKWHSVHLAPFNANYHEYKAAQRPDSKGFPMTDTITPALLAKMAEAPYRMRGVPRYKLKDRRKIYHVILNGIEIGGIDVRAERL